MWMWPVRNRKGCDNYDKVNYSAQIFYKSADARGNLHMLGLIPESGTTNALEIQQQPKNEKFDSERLPPLEEDFWFSDMILFDFTWNMILREIALQRQFNDCLKTRKLKLRVTIYNSQNQFFTKIGL